MYLSLCPIRQAAMLLVLAGTALVAAACGTFGTPPAGSQDPAGTAAGDELEMTEISMRFQWIPQWQFVGYIAAKVQGYYEDAGLDVTLNVGGPDFPVKQLVASGSDQFGTAWVDSMYLSQQQGVPLMSLATLFQANPSAYMVHSDSGIEGVEDFVGKTVAMYYGGGVETEYRAMLEAADVERDQIDEVPGTFNLEPFLQRRVDVMPIYLTDQPRTAREQGADIKLIQARDYGIVMMGDVLFATREFVEQHPNTVQAFVSASLRGWEWAVEHPEESIDLVLAYNPQLDAEHVAFEAEQTIDLITYGAGETCIGWNDPAAWEAEQQLLLDLDILEEPVPFEQVATNTFVAAYYQQQGRNCAIN